MKKLCIVAMLVIASPVVATAQMKDAMPMQEEMKKDGMATKDGMSKHTMPMKDEMTKDGMAMKDGMGKDAMAPKSDAMPMAEPAKK